MVYELNLSHKTGIAKNTLQWKHHTNIYLKYLNPTCGASVTARVSNTSETSNFRILARVLTGVCVITNMICKASLYQVISGFTQPCKTQLVHLTPFFIKLYLVLYNHLQNLITILNLIFFFSGMCCYQVISGHTLI